LDARGRRHAFWTTDAWERLDESTEALSIAIPWLLAVDPDGSAFGVLLDTTFRSVIDLTDTAGVRFRYLVTQQLIVAPSDYSVIAPTPDATLTLTSCHPKYSATQRFVVHGRLVAEVPRAEWDPSKWLTTPKGA
jgi:hypothetical protein